MTIRGVARSEGQTELVGAVWDELSAWHAEHVETPTNVVRYGSDVPTEAELRLLGDVRGRRIIDLGCGTGRNAIVLARAGAKVIAIDSSSAQLARARRHSELAEVKIEFHQADLAELAFVTTTSVDLALCTGALAFHDDPSRVFRQVHRILRSDSVFVLSVPHPVAQLLDPEGAHPLTIRRSWFDRRPIARTMGSVTVQEQRFSTSGLFTALHRANFAVDAMLEPEAPSGRPRSELWREAYHQVPSMLLLRARKLGV